MEATKGKKKLKKDHSTAYSRDSFDRFGDDLMNLIVAHLSIEDKFRFECLSQRIRSVIFSCQHTLKISLFRSADNLIALSDMIRDSEHRGAMLVRRNDAFQAVLKKLNSLRSIQFDTQMLIDNHLLYSIANNCLKLKKLRFDCRSYETITANCLKVLAQKCGQTLQSFTTKHFDCDSCRKLRQLVLTSLPHLKSTSLGRLNKLFDDFNHDLNCENRLPPNLEDIEFFCFNSPALQWLERQGLKKLNKIEAKIHTSTSDEINQSMQVFESFRRLECLNLYIGGQGFEFDMNSFGNGLRQMAKSLMLLRKLSFSLSIDALKENENQAQNRFFSMFEDFKTLASLEISLTTKKKIAVNYGSVQNIGRFPNLKRLKLAMDQLNDDNLKNIDLCFPSLMAIELKSNSYITDDTLNFLSNLKSLQTLDITYASKSSWMIMTDPGLEKVLDNCRHLGNIRISSGSGESAITNVIIFPLIKKARQKPTMTVSMNYRWKACHWNIIKSVMSWEQFPKNLYLLRYDLSP